MTPPSSAPRQTALTTARLRLEPLADEHLEHEVVLDADPDVMRYLGNGRPRSREEVVTLHESRLAEAHVVPGLGFWAGFLREPGPKGPAPFVGWWLLSPYERDGATRPDEAEIGYRLLPQFWRRGLATEGSRALLTYGFGTLGLTTVYAETMAVNEASRATMRALGMTHVRTYHPEFDEPIPGTELGEVVYRVTNPGAAPASR